MKREVKRAVWWIYGCLWCDNQYGRKFMLKRHIKEMHPEKFEKLTN